MESIQGRAAPASTTPIEFGFIGAHSDIGGGFEQGDLARVALVWMIQQARAAGVQIEDPAITSIGEYVVLHDKSDNLLTGGQPTARTEDRQVRYADGSVGTQRTMAGTTMTYADTQQYITYVADRGRPDFVTGTVDMRGYVQWLSDRGYGINLNVQ